MVLSSPAVPNARPQPLRCTGLGIAIALNLGVLLLLSLPRELVLPAPKPAAEPPPVIPFEPVPVKPLPVPPIPLPPTRPVARVPEPPPLAPVEPVVEAPSNWQIAIPPSEPAPPGETLQVSIPAPPTQVSVIVAPRPAYPAPAIRQGAQGTVVLLILVDIDGRPLEVDIEQSSGHRLLDRSARDTVLARWLFEPARRDGRPVQAWARVPIEFIAPR